MDFTFAAQVMNMMIALIVSLTLHEAAHAYAARLLGDDTAEREGRLTLNPIPHMDPMGTLLFPLMGSMMGGFIFGWAKPVPVDTRNLKNPEWDYVKVAAAGPIANLILCFLSVCGLIFYQLNYAATITEGHPMFAFVRLGESMVWINAILAIFNLLPIPPLDGGTVCRAFLPDSLKAPYDEYIAPYGMFILLAMFITGGLGWLGRLAAIYVGLCESTITSFF